MSASGAGQHRAAAIDAVKGAACLLIVLHHLAFYGPMSDAVAPYAPQLVQALSRHGRLAVQVFLVLAGYLAARSLLAMPAQALQRPARLVWRRYLRLVAPCVVALTASVLVAALVRPWFSHPSLPGVPQLPQLLSHLILAQDLLGQEALSAGIWYVAIDFQLYALTVLLLVLAMRRCEPASSAPEQGAVAGWLLAVAALTAASLFGFNRVSSLDVTALYFFGAYGLGVLAGWITLEPRRLSPGLVVLAAVGAAALVFDWRVRIAVALAAVLVLIAAQWHRAAAEPAPPGLVLRFLAGTGERSYSIFLIHFPVCLLINALVWRAFGADPVFNVLGLALAVLASWWAGDLLHRRVERMKLGWLRTLRWQARLVGMGLASGLVASVN